ncbi:MAG: 30S ribosomal protein S16 [Elusimicrobia bacterium]|nr:30S ribosomal protein S16 [Elusimicrobiota bacterium]
MLKIRLKRTGSKHKPFYRIVVIPSEKRRDGREIEKLGWYSPASRGKKFEMDVDRVDYWVSKGALVSPVVRRILTKSKEK